jgi:hypothetical protein
MEILVATSSDFALLRHGRPVAGGSWDDVVEAGAALADGVATVTLRLHGGAAFVARDDAPGWDDWLDAAESALPDMTPHGGWWPALAAGGAPVVVFRRDGGVA